MRSTRLFELTGGEAGARTFLFLTPTLANVIEGAPVEDVRFIRDEMANLAWAVERTVESPTGRAVDRYEAYQDEQLAQAEPAQPPPATAPAAAPMSESDRIAALKNLKDLLDSGVLTQAEFDAQKQRLLSG